MIGELKLKTWEGELDNIMHDCSAWLTSVLSEYSDRCILDITVNESSDGKGWLVTVYYRM